MNGAKPHGTHARYKSGCRCESCREANTVYYRERRRQDRFRKWAESLTQDDRDRLLEGVAAIMSSGRGPNAEAILDYLESERRASVLAGIARRKPGPTHGKPSTYASYGCRCDLCTTNYKAWKRQRQDMTRRDRNGT